MKMIMTEFTGMRRGYFRLKPLYKLLPLRACPRCGSTKHIGRTTCVVKPLPWRWRQAIRDQLP